MATRFDTYVYDATVALVDRAIPIDLGDPAAVERALINSHAHPYRDAPETSRLFISRVIRDAKEWDNDDA